MNKDRRKKLSEIIDRINDLKPKLDELKQLKEDIARDLEAIKDEEQEAFDNLAESFQQGEKGQDMEAAIDNMTTAYDALESIDLDADLDDVISNIDDARGQA